MVRSRLVRCPTRSDLDHEASPEGMLSLVRALSLFARDRLQRARSRGVAIVIWELGLHAARESQSRPTSTDSDFDPTVITPPEIEVRSR